VESVLSRSQSLTPKKCNICDGTSTLLENTKRGLIPHWYHLQLNGSNRLVCKKCYVRQKWQEKHVPKNEICNLCRKSTTVVSRYGTPIWIKANYGNNILLCKACYASTRDKGRHRPQEARNNIGIGIRKALDKGVEFGRKRYYLDESVFDTDTEEAAYWPGFLLTHGYVYAGKTGNPRIALTLSEKDYLHLVMFRNFLKCTNPIQQIKKVTSHKSFYSLRFSSRHISERLREYGIFPMKDPDAKVIGLENNRHFWRGVFDGDGYFNNKDGKDGDRMVLTGSNDLCAQFEEFIKKNISNARVTIRKIREYFKLYLYSDTARGVAKLLYSDCRISLDRKLVDAQRMSYAKDGE